MRLPVVPAAALALAGNFLLSLGMVLQKRNVGWLDPGRGWRRFASRAFGLWFLGFLLMNLVTVFNYLALLGLPPNVVSALIGSNVAFTLFLSAIFLKERPRTAALAWSAALFGALAVAGLRAAPGRGSVNLGALVVFLVLPLAAGALAVLRRRLRGGSEGLAVVIAGASGCLGGYLVLALGALQLTAGTSIGAWMASPVLLLYGVAGLSSFLLLQLSYKEGKLQSVSPAYYGLQVLWPALASYFVLAAPFDLIQALAMGAIILATAELARLPA